MRSYKEYKKALDDINDELYLPITQGNYGLIEKLKLVQGLADKERPLKPMRNRKGNDECSNCGSPVWIKNEHICEAYCDTCGQKIDWQE